MPQEPLVSMREALRPHLSEMHYAETDIAEIIEQCSITLGLVRAFQQGIGAGDLRDATKAVVDCLKKPWRPIEFESFMCILLNGGHVKLGSDLELVPA